MNRQKYVSEKKSLSSDFNIYIDLFNKGEFNEIRVTQDKLKYAVTYDNFKLGTITKDTSNSWIKVDGNMPKEKLEQIGNMINLKLLS